MPAEPPRRIFLTGFSFSGKSRVAPLVATTPRLARRRPRRPDRRGGGQGHIRRSSPTRASPASALRETAALQKACGETEVVVATGGGVVLAEENRRLMAESGVVVCLEARPETIYARLQQPDGGSESERPLLRGADPLGRIRHLKALRQPLYALADFTVHTDDLTPELVAEEVVRAWRRFAECLSYDGARLAGASAVGATAVLRDVPVEEAGPDLHRQDGDRRLSRLRGLGSSRQARREAAGGGPERRRLRHHRRQRAPPLRRPRSPTLSATRASPSTRTSFPRARRARRWSARRRSTIG